MSPLLALLLASAPTPAIEALSRTIARQLADAGVEPPVAMVLEGLEPAQRRGVETLLATALGQAGLTVVPAGAPEARSRLELALRLEGDRLVASGVARSTWVNFWSGTSRPVQSGTTLQAREPLDADSRSFLALREAAVELQLTPWLRVKGQVAALGSGDVDGDGVDEVALLLDEEVQLLSATATLLARGDVSSVPRAPSPSREPYGALMVLGGPARVVAWSASRTRAVTLALAARALRPIGSAEAITLGGLVVHLAPGRNHLAPELKAPSGSFTAGLAPQGVTGDASRWLLAFADGTGALGSGDVPPSGRFTGTGAGALADVDGDGTPEVVMTSDRTRGPDEVRLYAQTIVETAQARGAPLFASPAIWKSSIPERLIGAIGARLRPGRAHDVLLLGWTGSGESALYRLSAQEAR